MLIALDYDYTYTRDPAFWSAFITTAVQAGHNVVCVSMRFPHEPISMPCEVIYTGRKAKKPYSLSIGLLVDVWIDDSPEFILADAATVGASPLVG